ncbi:MAG: hypothetical protein GF365_04325 [Candidatus Buchananbacteria bacterium]|nr:hypothetical protein [Candidatus Buchananbacteria bacterium]
MNHYSNIEQIFNQASKCLKVTGFAFKVMNRKAPINTSKNFSVGYINLKTKIIALDIYTPKRRQPKSINSILRIIAHEIAHYQKKPYKQYFKGRWITRSHYPGFYKQVNKNIKKLQKDKELGEYFKK